AERFTAEQYDARGFGACGDGEFGRAGGAVADVTGGDSGAVEGYLAGVDEHAVLEARVDGNGDLRATGQVELGADDGRERGRRRGHAEQAAEEHAHTCPLVVEDGRHVALEERFPVAVAVGQGGPQLHAVQL